MRYPALVVIAICLIGGSTALFAQGDPFIPLSAAEVEGVTGIKQVHITEPGSHGNGLGTNYAGADNRVFLMLQVISASDFQRGKTAAQSAGTVTVKTFHAMVPGLGDEAYDGPDGPQQWVIYVRRGPWGVALTSLTLSMDQLKKLAAVAITHMRPPHERGS